MPMLVTLVISIVTVLSATAVAAASSLAEVTLEVEGMTCPGCEATVEAVLSGVDGVVEADADRTTQTAVVRFDPQQATPQDLAEAINDQTYYLASARSPVLPGSSSVAERATVPTSASEQGTPTYALWALAALVIAGTYLLINRRVARRSDRRASPADHAAASASERGWPDG